MNIKSLLSRLIWLVPALIVLSGTRIEAKPIVSPFSQGLYAPVQRKSLSEFEKVNLVLDRYRNEDANVISNGRPYDIKTMWRKAKKATLINKAYLKDAGSWIRTHFYRTRKGEILYVQYPNQPLIPLRDILLAELALINRAF